METPTPVPDGHAAFDPREALARSARLRDAGLALRRGTWFGTVTFFGAATLIWWATLFLLRRPAIDYLCVCAFLPLGFAGVWFVLGCQFIGLVRNDRDARRLPLIALGLLAFILAPYSLLRAGGDMFSLSVRYHLWRAGGAKKVQAAFNRWVAERPVIDESNGRKRLFDYMTPGMRIERLPMTQLPGEVRYIAERFPSRFGMSRDDVAYLDNVYVLTETDIAIGPPGWKPDRSLTVLGHLLGERRQVADGIWIYIGTYAK